MNLTSASFVTPMYNESKNIEDTVSKLTSMAKELTDDYEIIIADDGSTDGCGGIADEIAKKDPRVKVVHMPENTKFGGAFSAGLSAARKDIIIYTDSDLPVDFLDIKGALSIIEGADIVTAYSRIKKGESLKRIVISGVYNFLIQALFRTNIKDINSGLKIYKRKVFDGMELVSKSPFIDVEIFIKALKKNYVVKQYPVVFKHRQKGRSHISRPAIILKTFADMFKFKFSR